MNDKKENNFTEYEFDETIQHDSHIVESWAPLNTKVDKNFKFVSANIFFNFLGAITHFITFVLLFPFVSIFHGIKTKGRKHLKNIKGGIIVSNHIHAMDVVFIQTHGTYPRLPHILTAKEAFDVPIARHINKLLRAIPIPKNFSAKQKFAQAVNTLLKKKRLLIVFPEASLWPYYRKLRNFKNGAFSFSVRNNVPIIPVCQTFRSPNAFLRFFGKKKPTITLTYLPPIFPKVFLNSLIESDAEFQKKSVVKDVSHELIEKLKNYVHEQMEQVILQNNAIYEINLIKAKK